MDNQAIFVGVGGTGCKCLESMVHVVAAGLLKADCELLFIDQDKNNFCTGRARRVADTYQKLRKALDGSAEGVAPGQAFAASLRVRGDVLQPLPKNQETLETAFSVAHDPRAEPGGFDDAWLMRALFTERERADPMNNGFRARPAVGSAAYAISIAKARARSEASAMWPHIEAAVQEAIGRNSSRIDVVLFGSIFGGTGAAGLPSLGRKLREFARAKGAGKIHVAASLMLPYYFVTPPSGVADPYGPVPSGQVRLALDHYHRLMKGEDAQRPFDSIYLAGLEQLIELPYDTEGGGGMQDNAQLVPELVSALGAAHFVNSPPQPMAVHYSLREHANRMTLRDLPSAGTETPPGDALVDLLRFGLAYLCAYQPILWRMVRGQGSLDDYPFIRNYISSSQLKAAGQAFDEARIYFQELLSWAAAIEAHVPGRRITAGAPIYDRVAIRLFASEFFSESDTAEAKPHLKFGMNGAEADPPSSLVGEQIREVKAAFRALVADDSDLEMYTVLERLASHSFHRGARGAPHLLTALYRASRIGAR